MINSALEWFQMVVFAALGFLACVVIVLVSVIMLVWYVALSLIHLDFKYIDEGAKM